MDLGRIPYGEGLEIQRRTLEAVIEHRQPPTLLLVEHNPVITLGAGYHEENLRFPLASYAQMGIEVTPSDRGGDVTYHGPGQLVAYPIFDLNPLGRDLHRWLRTMEEVVIEALAHWQLPATRNEVNTGVWIGNRKICAMGIKVRRWVSMHGLALNCDIDLAGFQAIVPCGIQGKYGVTSLTQELGRPVTRDEAVPVLVAAFRRVQELSDAMATPSPLELNSR